MNVRVATRTLVAVVGFGCCVSSAASELLWSSVERVEAAIPLSQASLESAIGHELKRWGEDPDDHGVHFSADDLPIGGGLVIWGLHFRLRDGSKDWPTEVAIFGPRYPELRECVLEKDIKAHLVSFEEETFGSEHLGPYRAWRGMRPNGELTVIVQPGSGCIEWIFLRTNNVAR